MLTEDDEGLIIDGPSAAFPFIWLQDRSLSAGIPASRSTRLYMCRRRRRRDPAAHPTQPACKFSRGRSGSKERGVICVCSASADMGVDTAADESLAGRGVGRIPDASSFSWHPVIAGAVYISRTHSRQRVRQHAVHRSLSKVRIQRNVKSFALALGCAADGM
ncbi:hypothetical protein K438DRAFT_1767127 [Mycena galopus ATCC 62051]|nr:hypothetical protein K438DRAFT_1767127 [Mycena galopus ATCC 62051]